MLLQKFSLPELQSMQIDFALNAKMKKGENRCLGEIEGCLISKNNRAF